MNLSRYTVKNINSDSVQLPDESLFQLPERVLQFGTGVLLRGLPDYFIDKANRQGLFNGRIVVVKSTSGDTAAFDKQDGLYTHCVRGLQDGQRLEENIINSSISRVLSAQKDWEQVMECAHDHNIQVIISNTTEVGIQLVHDDIRHLPPRSYPGKLLAFLHERFKAFGGSLHSGLVIVPTELIPDNGNKLQSIVLELAHLNGLQDDFIEWLETANHFCNSLVDRIVPGRPEGETLAALQEELGYRDQLLIMSEVYRLWAIEGDEKIRSVLSFAAADEGVVIEENIDIYRELKLRLLNGTHTLSCGLAYLAGCETVKAAMDDELTATYITHLMQQEIAPSIPYDVDLDVAQDFGRKVLDRFRNPQIHHQWISITLNYSSKMKMRCVPVLLKHYQQYESVPELFSLGFAAYLLFMKVTEKKEGVYYGTYNGTQYEIKDEAAAEFEKRWRPNDSRKLVREVLQDNGWWGTNLYSLPGFADAVLNKLNGMLQHGVRHTVEQTLKAVV